MAATRRIPEGQLKSYFDAFTKRYLRDGSPETVDVEILSPELGDQPAVQGVQLIGITYDPGSRSLELALESGDHRVTDPREVWTVEEPTGFPTTIEVIRRDGARELIRVKQVGVQRIE